jgi:ferritin-like metal-binding protein YciE
MPSDGRSTRDAKLVQYLGEAFGNEKRLETALQAHIAIAKRAPYKRRLRQHLTETRAHARELSRRIKQLGGSRDPVPTPIVEAAEAVVGGAQKAGALALGPLQALRGTGETERQLKNAKTEYAEEAQEIGMYSAIETLAVALDDKDTAALARTILRDERRMFTFLEREIPRLSEAVARSEVPARERNGAAPRPARRSTRSARATRSSTRGASRRSSTRQSSRSRPRSARAPS